MMHSTGSRNTFISQCKECLYNVYFGWNRDRGSLNHQTFRQDKTVRKNTQKIEVEETTLSCATLCIVPIEVGAAKNRRGYVHKYAYIRKLNPQ